jgi:hypothetical protein
MAQHDMNIANQGFPAFRSDLNNALSAIQTNHSGTSRPSGAVAGQIWLDTTNATNPTLKFFDGTDDISLATIDYSANTVNWLDSTVSVTGLATTATGTVLTLSDTETTQTVNFIIDNEKEIRFSEADGNGSNYVALKAPASLTSDVTFTLPSADGTANQVLKTDGSGNLSFDTVSTAGTVLTTQGDILYRDGSGLQRLGAGTSGQALITQGTGANPIWSDAGGGKILQVVTSFKRDTASTTSTSYTNTGLSVSITPSSASNKILILSSWVAGISNSGYSAHFKLGGTTTTAVADAGGGGQSNTVTVGSVPTPSGLPASLVFEDSPNSTSAQTYDLQFKSTDAGITVYLNRSGFEDGNTGRSMSVMTAMEIGA